MTLEFNLKDLNEGIDRLLETKITPKSSFIAGPSWYCDRCLVYHDIKLENCPSFRYSGES